MSVARALSELVESVVAFVVMILLGVISFFVTVFVVKTGSEMAGYTASGDFVVLSASLLVAASVLAGIMNK